MRKVSVDEKCDIIQLIITRTGESIMSEEKKDQKLNKFSVPLGLLDYINPIMYTITAYQIYKHMEAAMGQPWHLVFTIGAALSLIFGFVIPTGKVIVGLGIIKFVMPVSLVFLVNSGIFISGLVLAKTVFAMSVPFIAAIFAVSVVFLIFVYSKSKKINTIAVLTGAVGYMLIYVSLITLSIRAGLTLPIILFAAAICLFVMLCGIGIKANLYDPKVHWVIEASNVICQSCVALGTVLLFKGM